jgi:hypothetical protein
MELDDHIGAEIVGAQAFPISMRHAPGRNSGAASRSDVISESPTMQTLDASTPKSSQARCKGIGSGLRRGQVSLPTIAVKNGSALIFRRALMESSGLCWSPTPRARPSI